MSYIVDHHGDALFVTGFSDSAMATVAINPKGEIRSLAEAKALLSARLDYPEDEMTFFSHPAGISLHRECGVFSIVLVSTHAKKLRALNKNDEGCSIECLRCRKILSEPTRGYCDSCESDLSSFKKSED